MSLCVRGSGQWFTHSKTRRGEEKGKVSLKLKQRGWDSVRHESDREEGRWYIYTSQWQDRSGSIVTTGRCLYSDQKFSFTECKCLNMRDVQSGSGSDLLTNLHAHASLSNHRRRTAQCSKTSCPNFLTFYMFVSFCCKLYTECPPCGWQN